MKSSFSCCAARNLIVPRVARSVLLKTKSLYYVVGAQRKVE